MPNTTSRNTKEIQEKINVANEVLQKNNYELDEIIAQELIDYFEGDAPSGDMTTLEDILNSEWLLIHELVEINELKKKGFEISAELLYTHADEVFKAHLIATEWELSLAREAEDLVWIKRRIDDVKIWLEDPSLSPQLKEKCNDLFQKFTNRQI